MKADRVLFEHHELIRQLMSRIAQTTAEQAQQRRELTDTLADELSIHEQIEDEIFYPALQEISPFVPIAHSEHRQLSDQLAAVLRTDPGCERFIEEFGALRSGVEYHAQVEETELFAEAQGLGDHQLDLLGRRLQERQQQLRSSRFSQLRLRAKRELLRRV